jgi:hypothetical protein
LTTKSSPKIQDSINFLFYSSYKLDLGRHIICKYRYQECIGACNFDSCNKNKIFYVQCRFFFFFLMFLCCNSIFFIFFLFLSQIYIQTSLNVRLKLNDAFKLFNINESLVNAKSALKWMKMQ